MKSIFVTAVAGVGLIAGLLVGCSSDKGAGSHAELRFDGKKYQMESVGCKSDGNVVKIHAGAIADNGNVDLKVDNGFMAEVVSGTQSQNVAIQYDKKNLWTIGPSVKKDGNTYTFNGEEMDSKKPYEMVVTCP